MYSADTRPARMPRGWPRFVGTRWLGAAGWPPTAAGWEPLLLLALCIPLFIAAYQVERPIAVDIGGAHEQPFLENFHAKEEPDEDGTTYRWTHATSFLAFKGVGGERDRRITLRLRSGRPPGATKPVAIVVNGVEVARATLGAEWQTVEAPVRGRAGEAHGLLVELRTTAERVPGVPGKEVGVQVDRLRVETVGGGWTTPAWDTFGALVLATLTLYLIAWRAHALVRGQRASHQGEGHGRWWGAAFGLAGATLLAALLAVARPYLAASDRTLLGILLGTLAALFLPGPLRRLGLRLGLAPTRAEATALSAILALGVAVKLGGLLYPDIVVGDLLWHTRWQRLLLQGEFAQLYFPSSISTGPREWGQGVLIPKSPLYYLFMAPVTLLPLAVETALKLVAGLLDLATPLFAYAFLRRIGRGSAGIAAALLYALTPLSYLLLSFGSYPTLFAGFLAALTFAVVLFAGDRLQRPGPFALFVALATLSLLAYPVAAVFDVCVLVTFGLWRWYDARRAHDQPAARRALLIPAGTTLAATLAFLLYYVHHVGVTLASVRTLGGQSPRAREASEGGPLDMLWHMVTIAAKDIVFGHLLLLLPLTAAGVLLLWRESGAGRLQHGAGVGDEGESGASGEVRRTWQFFLLWLLVLPIFTVVDSYMELLFKHLFFTMLPVAFFGGVTVAWLWRRGRAGQIVAVLCCVLIAVQAWWLWFQRIAYAGQVVN